MVYLRSLSALLLVGGSLINNSLAHPGEHHDHGEMAAHIAKRNAHADKLARGLEKCANKPSYQALQQRAHQRRAVKAKSLREKRGIAPYKPYKTKRSILASRDLAALETFETYNHNLTSNGYSTSTDTSVLFANYDNVSCILTAEVTWGPYYVQGEYIRSNVVDDQEGVAVHLEYQYIDVSTCEPATGLYVDTWNANATGVYSGVLGGNGNESDESNLNATFLRGIQPTDDDGVVAFDTLFPGHYEGRATHIHLIAHQNGTVLDNNTYSGGTISHVGQLFFQEDLRAAAQSVYPYTLDTQAVTSNDDDPYAPEEAANGYDPFADYAYLGDDISDGLLMWIAIGIDMSAEYTVTPAAVYTENGGVEESGGSGGAGGMSMSAGNGTMTGGAPTGSMGGGGPGSGTMTGGPPTGSGSMSGVSGSATVTGSAPVTTGTMSSMSGDSTMTGGPPSSTGSASGVSGSGTATGGSASASASNASTLESSMSMSASMPSASTLATSFTISMLSSTLLSSTFSTATSPAAYSSSGASSVKTKTKVSTTTVTNVQTVTKEVISKVYVTETITKYKKTKVCASTATD